jgi:Cu/Ag efflux protein CusF
MNKTIPLLLAATLTAGLSLPATAQQKPDAKMAALAASAPGTATLATATVISARVEAIDPAQRMLTVKGPKGNLQLLAAGPEVRNFDQIKVGDMVVARYVEALTLTLKKDGKELPSGARAVDAARAKPGEKPAGIVGQQVEITADVIAVDAKTQTLTLKGPQRTVDLRVPDPAQFKMVKVGDQIQAVYTEALALSVEPAAPAKK